MVQTKQQSGLVLVFTLVIILILTLSVVAGLRDSVNTQKMISSSNNYQYAFELAEAATLAVYDEIERMSDTSRFGTTAGYVNKGDAPSPFDLNRWQDESIPQALPGVDADKSPRFIVEYMNTISQQDTPSLEVPEYGVSGTSAQAEVFRVVVQATDKAGRSKQVIETFYAREF